VIDRFIARLNKANSTNLKSLNSILLVNATAAWYFAMSWTGRAIDPTVFLAWVGAVCANAGISYQQYKAKRETFIPDAHPTEGEKNDEG
jgi:hypothetical protein